MAADDIQARLRQLPGVDKLLLLVQKIDTRKRPHALLSTEIKYLIGSLREGLLAGNISTLPSDLELARRVLATLSRRENPSLKPVINASGILLHTNLGRAPLAQAALEQVQQVASGYSNLELDLDSGRRGSRHTHVEDLLCQLSGAEAALAVNNNAGAVLLALTALARGREAIVSRGELVEIGGSFRIPEVMEAGGVVLCEVGSSNRTHLQDYRQAINEKTGMLLKVHTSNYRIVGFTRSVGATELLPLAREHDLPLVEDLGSGLLCPLSGAGLPQEPTIAEGIAAGIDILTCSGDKLLGGPQAGLIFGRKRWIDKLRSHPLARALRIDKLSLAALEATLKLYLLGRQDQIPLRAFLGITSAELAARSRKLHEALAQFPLDIQQVEDEALIGGGAMPDARLPGPALELIARGVSVDTLAARLRQADLPLIGRIHDNRLRLNLRTVMPHEDQHLVALIAAALGETTV